MRKSDILWLIISVVLFVLFVVFAALWYIDGSAQYSTGKSLSPLYAAMALYAVWLQLRQMGIVGKNQSKAGKREDLVDSLKRSAIVLAVIVGFDAFAFLFLDLYDRAFLVLFSLTFTAIVFFGYRLIELRRFVRESEQIVDHAGDENNDDYASEEADEGPSVS